jgi:hypothetical protein
MPMAAIRFRIEGAEYGIGNPPVLAFSTKSLGGC